MSPVAVTIEKTKVSHLDSAEKDAINALYKELEKGIQSMKKGEVYTIDEVWEEIDKI